MALPGLIIWSLPFYASTVTEWIALLDLGPRAGPLVASIILFAVPSVFLGTISPYAIRLEVQSVETVGNTAGRLYALSTVGSILGTLAAVLLVDSIDRRARRPPWDSASLCCCSPLRPLRHRRRDDRPKEPLTRPPESSPASPWSFSSLSLSRRSAATGGVLYEKDSLYHKIIVRDEGDIRHLHFDNTYQSAMDLSRPDDLVFYYTRYLHLAKVFAPEARALSF